MSALLVPTAHMTLYFSHYQIFLIALEAETWKGLEIRSTINEIFNFLTNWFNQLILTVQYYKQEYWGMLLNRGIIRNNMVNE